MSRILGAIENSILILGMAAMSIVTFVNVLTRYLLDHSLAFTEEVTVNLFVLLTFMGASAGIRRKAHLGFSLLFEQTTGGLRLFFTLLIGTITSLIFFIVLYFGIDMLFFQMNLKQMTPALGWPQWVFSAGLPLGALFCLYRSVESTWGEVRQLLHKMGV